LAVQDRAGGVLSLRIALDGTPVVELARALARLEGVRVTGGPQGGADRGRSFLVHCLGFQMVLSAPAGEAGDFALAMVSRTPQAALGVMSDLGSVLERLMSVPPPSSQPAPAARYRPHPATDGSPVAMRASSALRRSGLKQGKPLARKTQLRRKTPLARGRFRTP